MQEGGPVVPSKEDKDSKQARADSKALVGNLNLTPKEKADKEAMEKEAMEKEGIFSNMGGPAVSTAKKIAKMASGNKDKPKKMNMGGMTSKMSKQKGGNTVIVDPAKKSPKSRMKTSGSGSKMAMMKEGGNIPKYKAGKKVRGYGKARGGKACKMR